MKNEGKVKALLSIGKCGVMDTNVECLICDEVEALGYFQIMDMRYDDRNAVTERISTAVLQL